MSMGPVCVYTAQASIAPLTPPHCLLAAFGQTNSFVTPATSVPVYYSNTELVWRLPGSVCTLYSSVVWSPHPFSTEESISPYWTTDTSWTNKSWRTTAVKEN